MNLSSKEASVLVKLAAFGAGITACTPAAPAVEATKLPDATKTPDALMPLTPVSMIEGITAVAADLTHDGAPVTIDPSIACYASATKEDAPLIATTSDGKSQLGVCEADMTLTLNGKKVTLEDTHIVTIRTGATDRLIIPLQVSDADGKPQWVEVVEKTDGGKTTHVLQKTDLRIALATEGKTAKATVTEGGTASTFMFDAADFDTGEFTPDTVIANVSQGLMGGNTEKLAESESALAIWKLKEGYAVRDAAGNVYTLGKESQQQGVWHSSYLKDGTLVVESDRYRFYTVDMTSSAGGQMKAFFIADFDMEPDSVSGTAFMISRSAEQPQPTAGRTETVFDLLTPDGMDSRKLVVSEQDGAANLFLVDGETTILLQKLGGDTAPSFNAEKFLETVMSLGVTDVKAAPPEPTAAPTATEMPKTTYALPTKANGEFDFSVGFESLPAIDGTTLRSEFPKITDYLTEQRLKTLGYTFDDATKQWITPAKNAPCDISWRYVDKTKEKAPKEYMMFNLVKGCTPDTMPAKFEAAFRLTGVEGVGDGVAVAFYRVSLTDQAQIQENGGIPFFYVPVVFLNRNTWGYKNGQKLDGLGDRQLQFQHYITAAKPTADYKSVELDNEIGLQTLSSLQRDQTSPLYQSAAVDQVLADWQKMIADPAQKGKIPFQQLKSLVFSGATTIFR